MIEKERQVIRELAKKYAEIANLPIQAERIKRLTDNNDLIAGRPPVWIEELPWHEMNVNGELDLVCEDPSLRWIEDYFRKILFRWKYFQVDMVVENFFSVYKTCNSTGFGIKADEDIIKSDDANHIVSHEYHDVLATEEDLEKITLPVITADKEQDAKNVAELEELFGDILPVRLRGHGTYHAPWDEISRLRGVDSLLYDLIDRPEFTHDLMDRLTNAYVAAFDQSLALGLLETNLSNMHCTPAYATNSGIWFRGMAQIFASVSPAMHKEFDIDYAKRVYSKCGLAYYGCCEPLDTKIDMLKENIPNLRKIGVSPWANEEVSAEKIGKDFVYARKPNPALVAGAFDAEVIKNETRKTVELCLKYGCSYELVLKDISTVSYKPENIFNWAKAVSETIDEYYK